MGVIYYINRGSGNVIIKVCEENAMNDAMFAPLSHDRADRHIKQPLSHIKAELEKEVARMYRQDVA